MIWIGNNRTGYLSVGPRRLEAAEKQFLVGGEVRGTVRHLGDEERDQLRSRQ